MADCHDPVLVFAEGHASGTVDLRTYRLSAVKKAAYRVADRCTVILGEMTDSCLVLTFMFPASTVEPAARESIRTFFQELLDQELREQLNEETQPVRALLLAHAFSRTDLIRR